MPELPEVETVRAGLERHVVGRTVDDVQVLHPRVVRRDLAGPAGFAAAMAGRPVKRAERRGKYLWLALDGDEALLAHLGMSGQLLVGDQDRPLSPHVRARFTFTDGGADLRFTDQRTFGHLMLVPFAQAGLEGATDTRELPAPIAHIAPDPMEAAFDAGDFAARLTRRHTGVKRALLDQSLISGVGNIYADEALWRARLHWARPTETLKRGEVSRLLEAVHEVLSEALTAGGTSFDALYVNINGESGWSGSIMSSWPLIPRCASRASSPTDSHRYLPRRLALSRPRPARPDSKSAGPAGCLRTARGCRTRTVSTVLPTT